MNQEVKSHSGTSQCGKQEVKVNGNSLSTDQVEDLEGVINPQISAKESSTARLVMILAGLWIGVLVVALDDTMLGTISGPVASSLRSFSHLSWIQTTFPIGASISQPLSGHLTDIFGRRKGLAVCYILFAVGTLLCGLATKLWVFILGRLVEGLGGGSIVSITAYVESDLVPLRKRALIEGLGNICYGVVLALGGVYGGAINEAIGWKWAFLVQPPLIALDGVLVMMYVRLPHKKTDISLLRRIDYFGGATLVLAIILLQLGLTSGGTSVGWNSPMVIVSLVISSFCFGTFVFWDFKKAIDPVIPIRAILNRTVAASQSSFLLASAASASIIFYVPIYLQVLGYSTGASGLRFIPMAIALASSSFVAGYLVKITGRYFHVNIVIQIFYVVGVALLCAMTTHTASWLPFLYLGLIGVGNGGASVTRLMGVLSSVDPDRQAVIQATSWTLESIGLAFGITIATTVFQKVSRSHLSLILFEKQPQLLHDLLLDFETLGQIPAGSERDAVVAAYVKATRAVFWVALAEIILAAGCSFLMRNNKIEDDDEDGQVQGSGEGEIQTGEKGEGNKEEEEKEQNTAELVPSEDVTMSRTKVEMGDAVNVS